MSAGYKAVWALVTVVAIEELQCNSVIGLSMAKIHTAQLAGAVSCKPNFADRTQADLRHTAQYVACRKI